MEIIYTPNAEDDLALLRHLDDQMRRKLRPPRGAGFVLGLILLGLGFASVLAVDIVILQDGRLSLVMGLGTLGLLGMFVLQRRNVRQREAQMAQERANSERQIRAAYDQGDLVRRCSVSIGPMDSFVQALEPAAERRRLALQGFELTADYLFLFEQGPGYVSLPRRAIPDLEQCLQLLAMVSSQSLLEERRKVE